MKLKEAVFIVDSGSRSYERRCRSKLHAKLSPAALLASSRVASILA